MRSEETAGDQVAKFSFQWSIKQNQKISNERLSRKFKPPRSDGSHVLISGPQLVIECCKQGIVGTFPALNQKPQKALKLGIEIKEALKALKKKPVKKLRLLESTLLFI